ncbi:hypothetical protein FOL47_009405 [Perkinsus chesapeaki]|uniref:CMP/dCMP-type deaminase domain-containing protein n=1 Tax=Perkinsus chesapeaki TaxID=330153 RepID=A0A7J6L8L1_PERCH|nr:hypothetical protein FOL47_009405 [Perkinsus chesapeaki]
MVERSEADDIDDEEFMRMALEESEKGRLTAPPNPWVGCVIVYNGKVVGKGYHIRKGGPHAEVNALRDVQQNNIDTDGKLTAYVTLEPCSHYGTTPPCCNALIDGKVNRVVVGIEDPDTKVSGEGLKRLRDAGIDVKVGCLADDITESLRPYIKHRRYGLPLVIGKVAASLNGMVCCEDGTSQWITGSKARENSHLTLRAPSQSILVGVGTVVADDCSLTVRGVEGVEKQPLRVVLDPRGRILRTAKILRTEDAPTLVVVGRGADTSGLEGVDILEVDWDAHGGLDLVAVLRHLADRGVFQVLVEGGAKTMTKFIEKDLVDELMCRDTVEDLMGADVLGAIKSRWMHLTSECYVNGGHLPAGIKRPISANEKDDAKRARIDLVEEEEKVEANGSDDDEEEDDEFADEFDDAEFVHATAAGQKASDEEHQRVAAAEAREHEREERQKEIERKELEEWSKIKGELIDEERLLAEEDSMWKQIPDPVNCPVKMYANVEVTEMGSNKRSKWNVSADRILLSTPRGEWLASSMEGSFLHLGAETAE